MYLRHKDMVMQYQYPGPKGAESIKRSSPTKPVKPKKIAPGQYCVEPQPLNLPHPWEQVLVVPFLGKKPEFSLRDGVGAVLLYVNPVDGALQQGDPRPDDSTDQLPEGWEKAFDDEGDAYFIDHNTGMMTYDDPRDGFDPIPSTYLMGKANDRSTQEITRRMTVANLGFTEAPEAAKAAEPKWTIGECDLPGYDALDFMLVDEDQIPAEARSKLHNRYLDILPTPSTRVPLPLKEGVPGSDYVNANYVRGADGNPQAFIAAMGPLPGSVNNFWRMIWQEKPSSIVMITGLVEKGRTKCERYWPAVADGKTMLSFGEIRVVSTSSEIRPGYVKSTLKITGIDSSSGKRKSHTMLHFWYNTWPDHGVPRKKENPLHTDDVLAMLEEVNSYASQQEKSKKLLTPVLVHCSAGIGRTGTYIAIDHEIKMLESTGEATPLSIVASLREDRPAMVQHPMQFKFVHEAAVRHCEIKKKPFTIIGEEERAERVASMAADADEQAEKENAKVRRAQSQSDTDAGPSVMARRSSARTKQNVGLRLGSIKYKGTSYEFLDPDGNGHMSLAESETQSMPAEFFRMVNKAGNGQITPKEFTKFKREQAMLASVTE